jgi:hypothetical protein
MKSSKKISASFFALILVCFLLPFVTISCENRPVVQLSGLEMTTGKTVASQTFSGRKRAQRIPSDGRTILAFLAAGIGLWASLSNVKRDSSIPLGCGFSGSLLLLLLKAGIDGQVSSQSVRVATFKADYGVGFVGAFLLFLSSAILNGWTLLRKK